MKSIKYLFILIILISCNQDNLDYWSGTDPDIVGYIPNSETASKIAEAVWLPIYGPEIYKEKPFKILLKNDSIWIVHGSNNNNGAEGGAAYIEINKKTGRIENVSHGE